MTDPRYTKLAKLLVNYSTALKKGDRVLLDMIDVPDEFSVELVRAVRAGGRRRRSSKCGTRGFPANCCWSMNDQQAALVRDLEMFRMKKMQAYIAIRGSANASENADVPGDRMAMYSQDHPAGAGLSRQQNALVRVALAHAEHGPGRRHEHRGVRKFVFRRLHDGLSQRWRAQWSRWSAA